MPTVKPHVLCKNGKAISIQASAGHYCSPRVDDLAFYTHYELLYVIQSKAELDLLKQYSVQGDRELFGMVPVHVICELISMNGGLLDAWE